MFCAPLRLHCLKSTLTQLRNPMDPTLPLFQFLLYLVLLNFLNSFSPSLEFFLLLWVFFKLFACFSSLAPSLNIGVSQFLSLQFTSVAQSCPTLCDPMDCSTPGLPVHHQLPEFTQTHLHRVSDAVQPSHPLLSPSPPAPNPSQHQGLFQ